MIRRILIETAFIFAACYLFAVGMQILYRADVTLLILKWALLDGLLYGAACWVIYIISMKLFRSEIVFAFLSLAAAAVLIKLGLDSAASGQLNSRINGVTLFEGGEPTFMGILDLMLNPLTFLALYALICAALAFKKRAKPTSE